MPRGKPFRLQGQRFGLLTVLRRATGNERPPGKNKPSRWICRCDCGVERGFRGTYLLDGRSKICGQNGHRTQLLSALHQPEYSSWSGMRRRCLNPKSPRYKHYGARGIMVCDRWRGSFDNFFIDMGERPTTKHSLERIDNNGNYEPGNCRWATDKEQRRNTQRTVFVEFDGHRISLADYCEITGIKRNTIKSRLDRGWTLQEAVTIPTAGNQIKVARSPFTVALKIPA